MPLKKTLGVDVRIVVAETLACGKQVLIGNKVKIWRGFENDAPGFVDSDTSEGTVSNPQRWLTLRPDEYVAMSNRAPACFESRFYIKRATERLVEFIRGNIQ